MKLSEIGEFGFIKRIKPGCLIRQAGVVKGIGDDCCVFRKSDKTVTVFTTDMLVDNIHFFRHSMPPYLLGRKSLAVNLSDIAAMGAIPREFVVSVAVPETVNVEYLDSVYDGMKSMAKEFDVNLLGGDTSSSPEHLVINIALIGEALEDEVLYRSGARAGDIIFLTGSVGSSAAGLDILLSKRVFDDQEELINAHYDPYPHVKAGRIIAGSKMAHSLIDVSDGVASDLGHLCHESQLGAIIEKNKIPVTDAFGRYCENFKLDFEHLTLHVGEDYVLLGTVPENLAENLKKVLNSNGCEFYSIGRMVPEKGIKVKDSDGSLREIKKAGYNSLKGNS